MLLLFGRCVLWPRVLLFILHQSRVESRPIEIHIFQKRVVNIHWIKENVNYWSKGECLSFRYLATCLGQARLQQRDRATERRGRTLKRRPGKVKMSDQEHQQTAHDEGEYREGEEYHHHEEEGASSPYAEGGDEYNHQTHYDEHEPYYGVRILPSSPFSLVHVPFVWQAMSPAPPLILFGLPHHLLIKRFIGSTFSPNNNKFRVEVINHNMKAGDSGKGEGHLRLHSGER